MKVRSLNTAISGENEQGVEDWVANLERESFGAARSKEM
jgi:hypothetical protein